MILEVACRNIYVPDDIEERIRAQASKEGKTISGLLAEIIKSRFAVKKSQTNYFSQFFGTWEGEFAEVDRALTTERDDL